MKREDYIKQEIKNKGYNLKDFAAEIDMPYTTLLSIVNKSIGGAALDNVLKICNGLNISIESLNPYKTTSTTTLYPTKYDELNITGKEKANEYIEVLSENPKYIEHRSPEAEEKVRPVRIAAKGQGTFAKSISDEQRKRAIAALHDMQDEEE